MGISVLIVGGGGREHALAWKIVKSPLVSKIYAAPGNPGIARHAECVPLAADDLDGLRDFAVSRKIDLTVIGPETPLAAGLTDLLAKEGLLVCGPDRAGAQMEGSKVFMKTILWKYGIPTASFQVFDEYEEAEKEEGVVVFHAGTAMKDGRLVNNGGRVLGVTAIGDTLKEAIARAYRAVNKIHWEGAYWRTDIGRKALERGNG